jgi:3'-phosphoadenosine 5'-phosphosulfate sulfotransferase (PAPS reductase)/FAD synthetase
MIPTMHLSDFDTYIVAVSGGKDSAATALWALDTLPRDRLRFAFCDTGAEWPETYDYLNYLERELAIEIERLKPGDRPLPPTKSGKPRESMAHGKSLFDCARLRGKWPRPRYRFCTTYLKQWPLRLYADEFENPLQLEGSRREESKRRSKYDPWTNGGSNTVNNPFLKPAPPSFRPVLEWTECQVWDYLRAHGILPNPMYNYATRCGCWCCIMGKRQEVFNFCRLHPEIAQIAADLEVEINHTWRPRWSIGQILRQAGAQMDLFEPRPRFEKVAGGQ